MIRLSRSTVGEEEKRAVARVLDDGYLGMGAEVQAFEQELKAYLDTDLEVIAVSSGTAALHLAIACLDIGPGDEVLIPSITYVASFQAVAATGARPVACDISLDRIFIDLDDAASRITERTRAIMPVHYASDATSMNEVYRFAARHGLRVVEDAAHSFGGARDGVRVGQSGDVICFSFDGIKNITCGEGGALLTGDLSLARRAQDARLLGVEKDTEKRFSGRRSWDFDVQQLGFRYHMSNLMAAIGREQLRKVGDFTRHRRVCVERYRDAFSNSNAIQLLDLKYDQIAPHIFAIRVSAVYRDGLVSYLREKGIECGMHYKPNHLLTRFGDGEARPCAEAAYAELVSLPLHAALTEAEQETVIAEVLRYLSEPARA